MQDRCRLAHLNPQANETSMKKNKEKTTTVTGQPVTEPGRQIAGMIEVLGRPHCPSRPPAAAKKRSALFLQINFTIQSTLYERARQRRDKNKP